MRTLLVPVDGSDSADRAVKYAISLAKNRKGTELHLVTVHPEPVIYGEVQIYVSQKQVEESQRKHSESILAPAVKTVKAARIPHTASILVGDAAPMIAKQAKKLGCDGIVMGTRGMSAVGNLVMGSVAAKVVHLTKLPVTLVK